MVLIDGRQREKGDDDKKKNTIRKLVSRCGTTFTLSIEGDLGVARSPATGLDGCRGLLGRERGGAQLVILTEVVVDADGRQRGGPQADAAQRQRRQRRAAQRRQAAQRRHAAQWRRTAQRRHAAAARRRPLAERARSARTCVRIEQYY